MTTFAQGRMDGQHTLRRRGSATAPLAYAQERLWFADVAEQAAGSAYNVPLLLPWRGRADETALAAALEAVVARHEALRTVYRITGGAPEQIVLAPRPVPVRVLAAAGAPDPGELAGPAGTPFDLTAEQPIRCVLWRATDRDHVLLTFHHVAVDGWSLAPLFTDLAIAYGEAVTGGVPALAEPPLQFADFAAWERESGAAIEDVAARAAQLAPVVADLRLAGAAGVTRDGARPGGEHRFVISPKLWRSVAELGRRLRSTPFVVLFAAFQELLRRWTDAQDFLVGSIMANRPHSVLADTVGFFANTVPLRCRPHARLTFEELCVQTRAESYHALTLQGLPLHHLASQVATIRGSGRTPLVAIGFTVQNMPVPQIPVPWDRPRLLTTGIARFDLMMILEEEDGSGAGSLEYDARMYPEPVVTAFAGGFLTLLAAAVAAPGAPLASLRLTGGALPNGVLVGEAPVTVEDSVLPLIAQRLAERPDDPAVTAGGEAVSRGALDRWSAAAAGMLVRAGIGPGDHVPVLAGRGGALVAGWLGTLRTGAAFVALALDMPPLRLRDIIIATGSRVVAADAEGAGTLAELDLPLTIVDLDAAAGDEPTATATAVPGPDAAAVVFHTSGTTGTPKGVLVPHRGLANSVTWWARDAKLTSADRVLCAVGSGFDPCTFETFRCLIAGSELVFADDTERRDGAALRVLLDGCTVAAMTPSLIRMILDAAGPAAPALRLLYLGGEPLTRALVDRVATTWPAAQVRNLYGPTEASCNATCSPIGLDDGDEPAIGRPIAGTRAYVLGSAGEELAAGAVGELFLAGRGVALGYLNRPEETESAFPADPFEPGARMYRTGDRAAIRPDGQLEFHGRHDEQVKILGNRVELGEVTRLLERHPAVATAAVDAVGEPKRLVAYVVLAPGADPSREDLVRPLARQLPPAALPSEVRVIEALPLTGNGKVDLAALRVTPTRVVQDRASGPLTVPQARAADMFAATLGLAPAARAALGPDADFFALGGHSLMAVAMLAGSTVPLRRFLAEPTVDGLTRALAAEGIAATAPVVPVDAADHPATAVQAAFYLLDRVATLRPAYLAPSLLRLRAQAEPSAVRAAVDTVLARHPALRCRFTFDLTARKLTYRTDGPPATCAVVDATGWAAEAFDKHLAGVCGDPMDLRGDPPVRAEILTRAGHAPLLVLTAHHIAVDGWSHGLLLNEIEAAYRGAELPPAVHPAGLRDEWAARSAERRAADLAEVVARLSGAPTDITLPYDHPRDGVQRTEAAACATTLPPATSAALRQVLAATGTTLAMASAAAVAVALARHGDQRDFLFAYPWAGRDGADRSRAVAMLVNTAVLRVDVGRVTTWRELLDQVRADSLASYRTAHVPFDAVANALAPQRDMSRPRLTPILLASAIGWPAGELFEGELAPPHPRVKAELELTTAEPAGQVSLTLAYATARFERRTAENLLTRLVSAVTDMAARVDGPLLEGLP